MRARNLVLHLASDCNPRPYTRSGPLQQCGEKEKTESHTAEVIAARGTRETFEPSVVVAADSIPLFSLCLLCVLELDKERKLESLEGEEPEGESPPLHLAR